MRRRLLNTMQLMSRWCVACCCLALLCINLDAQTPSKSCKVSDGKMYIELSKALNEASLDSFINQFALQNLAIKRFLRSGFTDSIHSLGWQILVNNQQSLVIFKPIMAFDDIFNAADKIKYLDKHIQVAMEFPSVSGNIIFGQNRFRNKFPFLIRDSVVYFYLRNNLKATRVMLAGSFNDWNPDVLAMTKTDSGWVAGVKLSPGKYWYKFIVDDHWIIDNDNRLNENDGRGNTNSVFYYTNTIFRLDGFMGAKKVFLAGSFNEWQESDLPMVRTATGWELPLYLADGTHTYRFIVGGRWMTDPANSERLPNEFNDYNSVIRKGEPHLFFLKGYTEAKEVILTGSFNRWRMDELYMKKTATGWELPYTLGPGNYAYRYRVDGRWATDTGQQLLNVEPGKAPTSAIVINPNYVFRLKDYPQARSVFLAGDFNDWSSTSMPMKKEGGDWVFMVHLSPGKHLYKFIVDGNWIIDKANTLWEQNELGNANSVLWIEAARE